MPGSTPADAREFAPAAVLLRRAPRRRPEPPAATGEPDPAAPVAPAPWRRPRRSLQEGETQIAESHYRDALHGGLAAHGRARDGRGTADLRRATPSATPSAVGGREPRRRSSPWSLAHLQLRRGRPGRRDPDAAPRQEPAGPADPRGCSRRRSWRTGQPEQAVQELEEARAARARRPRAGLRARARLPAAEEGRRGRAPLREDPRGAADRADPRARSAAPTATSASTSARAPSCEAALKLDPRVRRAHYYLGHGDADARTGVSRARRRHRGVPGRS